VLAELVMLLLESFTGEVCKSGHNSQNFLSKAHSGLRVIATARRLETMAGLAAQGIETLELDVTDDDSVRKTREATAKLTGGKLDILVNNA
jgi:1-acylglycerone phosphate reductase